MRRFRLWIVLAVVLALPAMPRRAQADPIMLCCQGTFIPPALVWDLGIIIGSGFELLNGDYVTFSTVGGFVGGATPGCHWPPKLGDPSCSWSTPLMGPRTATFTWTSDANPATAGMYYMFLFETTTDPPGFGLSGQATNVETGQKVVWGGAVLTPEPSTILLLGTGLASIGVFGRRHRKRSRLSDLN